MYGIKGLCNVGVEKEQTTVVSGCDCIAAVKKNYMQLKPRLQGFSDLTHLDRGLKKTISEDEAPKIQFQRVPK